VTTGFIYDEQFLLHDNGDAILFHPPIPEQPPEEHVANPRLISRTKELLDRTGLTAQLVAVPPRRAAVEEILAIHDSDYVAGVRAMSDGSGGDAGDGALVGPGSYEIALLSAGGAIAAVDAVMDGQVDNAYALLRPPGHHAIADLGMGFCLFNNVAIAARHAQRRGIERIAVVDWDVHHGNGTNAAFHADRSVLFISLHQDGLYPPGSGSVEDTGAVGAEGFTVNIPLPPGTGDASYLAAFERIVIPILDKFRPDLILVSAGQDPSAYDPLGRMLVTSEGFRNLTRQIKRSAETLCDGKLVVCHEGGYSTSYVPFCTVAVIEELSGQRGTVGDVLLDELKLVGGINTISRDATAAIDRAVGVQSKYWDLS